MNDYVVPKEVIEWAKEEIYCNEEHEDMWSVGYRSALKNLLKKINVVYTKEVNND